MPINLSEEQQIRIVMSFGLNKAQADTVVDALRKVSSGIKEMDAAIQGQGVSANASASIVQSLKEQVNVQQAISREKRIQADLQREALRTYQQELSDNQTLNKLFKERNQANFGGGVFGSSMANRGMGPGFAEFMLAMSMRSIPGMMGSPIAEGVMGASSINSAISMIQRMADEAGGLGPALASVGRELGPMTIAFTALIGVMKLLEGVQADVKKQMDAYIASLNAVNANNNKYQMALTATTQQIEMARQQHDNYIRTLQDQKNQLQAQINAAAQLGIGWRAVDEAAYHNQQALRDQLDATNKKIAETDAAFAQVSDPMVVAAARMRDYNNALKEQIDYFLQREKINKTGGVAAAEALVNQYQADLDKAQLVVSENFSKVMRIGAVAVKDGVSSISTETLAELDKLKAALQAGDLQSVLGALSSGAFTLSSADNELLKAVNDANNATPQLSQRLKELTSDFIRLQAELKRQADWDTFTKGLSALKTELAKASEDVAAATKSIKDLDDAYAEQQQTSAEAAVKEAERYRQEQAWKKRIDDAKAAEKLADGEDKLAKARAKGEADLAKLKDDEWQKEQELLRDHLIAEGKAYQEFTTNDLRAHTDYLVQYSRDSIDIRDKMAEDASNRDVLSWIREKAAGQKKLDRETEDAQIADSRRHEDYERKRVEDDQAYDRQLGDLRWALGEQTVAKRAALNAQLAEERAAMTQRVLQSQILENQFAAVQRAWKVQDQAAQQADELASYQKRRIALQNHLIEMEALYANLSFRLNASSMPQSYYGNNQPGYAPAAPNSFASAPIGSYLNNSRSQTVNQNINVSSGISESSLAGALGQMANDIMGALRSI